jgi:hypothetical protein
MQMHKPDSGNGGFGVKKFWYDAIDDPGAAQMQHLKNLMLSRPYLERIPDPSLIAGKNGEQYDYVIATRSKNYLFVYTYTGRPFRIKMGAISGKQARAWWYDPRNGSATEIGIFENKGERAFEPPGDAAPGNDWVLVLDDTEASFNAPGKSQKP